MRALFSILLAFSFLMPVNAALPVPRKAGEFVINMTSGSELLLSSFKGKVVMVEFLFTRCPHCQDSTRIMNKLYAELGPKGFQPVGIAIDTMDHMLVPDFIKAFNVKYPVGYAQREAALKYLGFNPMERWVVPQIMVIDRQGNIRMQTPAAGDPAMQTEAGMRAEIEKLLNERSGPAAKPAATTPASKKKAG